MFVWLSVCDACCVFLMISGVDVGCRFWIGLLCFSLFVFLYFVCWRYGFDGLDVGVCL